MVDIIPTCTSPQSLSEIERRVGVFKAFAEWVQIDIVDGAFVSALSWPYASGQWAELEACASGRLLPHAGDVRYEAHLMVRDPYPLGELLVRAGCERIIAHAEVFSGPEEMRRACADWKKAGVREVGLALCLPTPLEDIDPVIADCDVVQLMSIATLGAQGAPFESRIVPRIREMHERYPHTVIAVDGGVSETNIADMVRAGASRFGVGSAIEKSDNPADAYARIKQAAESALQ